MQSSALSIVQLVNPLTDPGTGEQPGLSICGTANNFGRPTTGNGGELQCIALHPDPTSFL